MTPRKKTALRCAGIAIAAGALLVLAAFVMTRGDLARLSTAATETNTYEITEPFTGVDIRVPSADVRFAASSDGKTRIESRRNTRLRETVEVTSGVLTVAQTDAGRWYEYIGFFYGAEESMTVYLPADALDSLTVQTASGDIAAGAPFTFERVRLKTASGEVDFSAQARENLLIETVSGDITAAGTATLNAAISATSGEIRLAHLSVADILTVTAVSGDLELEGVTVAGAADLETTSGEVELTDTRVADCLVINTVSGDVELENSEGETMYIHTTSGDVTGTLPRAKDFELKSTTGRNWYSASSSDGGLCEVTSTSGDIVLYVEE